MFTLDQVRSFVAVAEELHFGRAADRLRMTQPPLSRQIQKLERELNSALLERGSRGVTLTRAGETFLDEARRLLAISDQAPAKTRRVAEGRAGVLRIGFTAASAFGVLGELLGTLGRELPELDIELSELVTADQLALLAHDELDLALARPPVDPDVFGSRLLHSESLRIAVPDTMDLGHPGDPVTPEDLQDVPIIMHSPTRARYFYDLAIRNVPVQHQNVVHTVSQILTMMSLVASGRGVAFVPASADYLHIDGVHLQELSDSREQVELHAVWHHDHRNPAISRVLDLLENSAPLR